MVQITAGLSSVLEPHCQTIEPILDWFHIAKFQNVKMLWVKPLANPLSAKWTLWHGEAEETLKNRINPRCISDEKKQSKLKVARLS